MKLVKDRNESGKKHKEYWISIMTPWDRQTLIPSAGEEWAATEIRT
jgi:hypothetical protein